VLHAACSPEAASRLNIIRSIEKVLSAPTVLRSPRATTARRDGVRCCFSMPHKKARQPANVPIPGQLKLEAEQATHRYM
jgi:hypothetical protein